MYVRFQTVVFGSEFNSVFWSRSEIKKAYLRARSSDKAYLKSKTNVKKSQKMPQSRVENKKNQSSILCCILFKSKAKNKSTKIYLLKKK